MFSRRVGRSSCVGGSGRRTVGHHSFLGVMKVDATAATPLLSKYDSSDKVTSNSKDSAPVPASQVACHAAPSAGSGISVLNCKCVHLPAVTGGDTESDSSRVSRRVIGQLASCTVRRNIGCFSASPTCYGKHSRRTVKVTLDHCPHSGCCVTAGLSGFSPSA